MIILFDQEPFSGYNKDFDELEPSHRILNQKSEDQGFDSPDSVNLQP